MLEQVLAFIHNYFEREIYCGHFAIRRNQLQVHFLKQNQYFRIVGSTFNDGVYKHPYYGLANEEFEGQVWAMAVPPTLIALIEEIEAWVAKYGDAVASPYTSESFGGYSYSKASGSGGNTSLKSSTGWQDVFASRLNQWRKIA